jgi:chromosome segregation ATPase
MPDTPTDEMRLAAEIEQLKATVPRTRDLYREVCALLFFRYSVTPTANRLYQLVRKGSMSTPTEVLAEFWRLLREKSRARIEHPDLPEDLQAAAGELVATLWTRSTALAHASLSSLRTDVEAAKSAAQASVTALQAELVRTESALEQRTSALLAAQVRIQELEQARAASDAARQVLEAENARVQAENRAQAQSLTQVGADFSRELEKLRAGIDQAETRLRMTEQRATRDAEHDRADNARLREELNVAASKRDEDEIRHRDEVRRLQAELGDARHQVGVMEGNLEAVRAAHAACLKERDLLRDALTGARATHAGGRRVSPGNTMGDARTSSITNPPGEEQERSTGNRTT